MIATVEVLLNSNDQSVQNLVSQALPVYLRSHYTCLTQNEEIEMIDLSYISNLNNELILKLLLSKELMDLSKSELIITLYVKRLYLNEFKLNLNNEIDVDNILNSLNDLKLIEFKKINEVINIEELEFEFIYYNNLKDDISIEDYLNELNLSVEIKSFFNQSIELNLLPNLKFDLIWNDLKLQDSIKLKIFNQLNNSILNFKNLILLIYGEPGSGKSTLCKSISQKLSIYNQFKNNSKTLLLEISFDKVFSKWYGESSTNLINLFKILKELIVKNSNDLIILIIDEVETLANSRIQILNKNETSDGIRIVNTLLTQLDSLKQYNNFLILSTSNLIDSIDEAFLDRVDYVFRLDKPDFENILKIFQNELNKLIKSKKLINDLIELDKINLILLKISKICHSDLNLSGRSIIKIPLICLSEFNNEPIKVSIYLQVLANHIITKVLDQRS